MSDGQLDIQGLTVEYQGRPAVVDAHVTVAAGEITALLGPNGAGKSSIVGALAGLVPAAAGTVTVDGAALRLGSAGRTRRAGAAVVPEGHRVLGDLTVADNLRVATALLPRRQRREGQNRALALFPELAVLLHRRAGLLSGGEQQILALAQAFSTAPRYIVVDELSLGLAPIVVARLARALKEIASAGAGVLLIEQFTAVALDLAHRASVLQRGRIVFDGDPDALRDQPELLRSAYLAEAS